MNDYMHVEYHGTRTERLMVAGDGFVINAKKSMNWIQRIAYKYLTKVGVIVPAMIERVKASHFTINTNEFLKNLHAQMGDVRRITNSRNNKVFMGYDDFQRMANLPELAGRHMFNFDISGQDSIMGMKIEVIPWMSGVLVVPDGR